MVLAAGSDLSRPHPHHENHPVPDAATIAQERTRCAPTGSTCSPRHGSTSTRRRAAPSSRTEPARAWRSPVDERPPLSVVASSLVCAVLFQTTLFFARFSSSKSSPLSSSSWSVSGGCPGPLDVAGCERRRRSLETK